MGLKYLGPKPIIFENVWSENHVLKFDLNFCEQKNPAAVKNRNRPQPATARQDPFRHGCGDLEAGP